MEEILASIRRIIADDGEPAEEHAAPPPAPAEAVLELTQRVDDNDEPIVKPPRAEPVLAPVVPIVPPVRAQPAPPPPAPPPPAPPKPSPTALEAPAQSEVDRLMAEPVMQKRVAAPAPSEEPRLISEASETASTRAFAEIASFTKARRDLLMGNGERTLEDITRELLRPLLKDWLDQNLPGLVQRLVKEEIERMVRQGAAD